MDNKGFVFTTDILLALVIVTLAIGMASNQVVNLNYQLQDFTGRQSMEKTVNDAADYLVKNPGNPSNWETLGTKPPNTLPGLATNRSVYVQNHLIDTDKMYSLNNNPSLLVNLVNPGGNPSQTNYRLQINQINNDGNIGKNMIDISNNVNSLSSAKEVAIANRTLMLIAGKKVFDMIDLHHNNPSFNGPNTFLWYWSGHGNPNAKYVGPGNTTGQNSSFTPDLNNYDYFIYVTKGSGKNPGVQYGITGGDEVVNITYYGDFSNDTRLDNLNAVVKAPGRNFTWVDMGKPEKDDFYNITPYLSYVQSTGKSYMKLWISSGSGDPKEAYDLELRAVPKGETNIIKSPAKLVLTIWE